MFGITAMVEAAKAKAREDEAMTVRFCVESPRGPQAGKLALCINCEKYWPKDEPRPVCFTIPSIPMVSAAEAVTARGNLIVRYERLQQEQERRASIREGRRLEREEIARLIRDCLDCQTKLGSISFLPNPVPRALSALLAAIEARSA